MGKKDGGFKMKDHKGKGNKNKNDCNQQTTKTNKIFKKNSKVGIENNIIK